MQHYFELFRQNRIAVIGDLMLDCYMSGEVRRISPEAPVPVLRVISESKVPGGAANVASNLASLGLRVSVVGLAGEDEVKTDLIDALAAQGDIDCRGIICVPGRRTTRKLRIIGEHQQIVRVDHEDHFLCDDLSKARLIDASYRAIDQCSVVILSDYGKGVCNDHVLEAIISRTRAIGKTLLVDPKRLDFNAYRGATLLTPNRTELSQATGLPCETDEQAEQAAAKAQQLCGADILLTRSERGMSFFPVDGAPIHMPTVARDVFDVSGAGDTVVAVLAATLAVGMPFDEGMRAANHAAGIVVSKIGTACVTQGELAQSLALQDITTEEDNGRLLSLEQAIALRAVWEREKLSVGLANGCFDLLHPGHISLLRQAAQNCDRLIVALNSDSSVRRLKGPSRPVQDETARAIVMGSIKGVAATILFDEDTPMELITALQPDLLVKGADYKIEDVVGADLVQNRNGRVLLVDLTVGCSTSAIIARSSLP